MSCTVYFLFHRHLACVSPVLKLKAVCKGKMGLEEISHKHCYHCACWLQTKEPVRAQLIGLLLKVLPISKVFQS